MSDLSSVEKHKLEKLLGMGSGYVLDFTNWTFAEFMFENAGIDIYDEKYNYATASKANRLRKFWKVEGNYVVGGLTQDLIDYWYALQFTSGREITTDKQALHDDCKKITARLLEGSATEHLDAIEPYSDERDVALLRKQIRESLQANEPEVALDRLHTYAVKFVRHICDKHGIEYDQKRPLHALYGQYVKYLSSNGLIETEMTERILKTFIQLLEEFNHVRNKRSLAHDNPILNYNESELIVSGVMVALKFLRSFEEEPSSQGKDEESIEEWDEIPF